MLCTRHSFIHTANALPQLKSICRSCLSRKCSNSKCFPSCTKYSKLIQKKKISFMQLYYVLFYCLRQFLMTAPLATSPQTPPISLYLLECCAQNSGQRATFYFAKLFAVEEFSSYDSFQGLAPCHSMRERLEAMMNSQGSGATSHKQLFSPWQWTRASNNERQGVQASSQDSNVSIFTPSCPFPLG